jgi:mono/diheme cytochrome c family protein
MRLRKPRWLTASAAAFLVPALLIGFASVALAAASPAPLAGDATKGKAVYSGSTCATCHGPTLGGGVGPALHPIKNLGDTKDPLDPQYLIDTITLGKSGLGGFGQMPAKGGDSKLADQDIKDLAAFIIGENQLKGPQPYPPGVLAESTIAWVTIGTLAMLALTFLLSRYNMRWIARKSGRG